MNSVLMRGKKQKRRERKDMFTVEKLKALNRIRASSMLCFRLEKCECLISVTGAQYTEDTPTN